MAEDKKMTQAEGQENPKKDDSTKKAKRTVNWFFVTINRARKVFDMQLDKSNALKFRCLKNQVGRECDQQKFFNDYMGYVDYLMDSHRFTNQCNEEGIDARILATHVVFLGSAVMHKVKENGIYDPCIVGDLDLYKEAFLPENAQAFAKPIA